MQPTEHVVLETMEGARLDRFLADRRDELSRSVIQTAIREGAAMIDGAPCTQPSRRLRAGERIAFDYSPPALLRPQPVDLHVLHEDEDIIVVDKPPGLVVHPGAGTEEPTLVEALLHQRDLPPTDDARRPGIVHRLDKDTSGVVVVAKRATALAELQRQFAEREVVKLYLAVARGRIAEEEALIDAPIGRDPRVPRRMAVTAAGRPSRTLLRVLRREDRSSLLLVRPITGRTHQVRIHLRYIGHPVCGDRLYGRGDGRLMLHAWRLQLRHPSNGALCLFEATVPQEFPAYPYDSIAALEMR
jgi:23S rRNA pseudouridine1911/1915/1917 synthase